VTFTDQHGGSLARSDRVAYGLVMSSRTRIAALAAWLIAFGLAGSGCNRSAPSAPPSVHVAKPGEVAPTAKAAKPGDVGAKAPDAQLSQTSGVKIALADLLPKHAQTVVVFYRGFW
jgi:hypothetical protein